MFTAIIAALFDEKVAILSQYHEALLQSIHDRLRNLAAGKMHASVLIVTWFRNKNQVKITNAGHPFPIMRMLNAEKSQSLKIPSTPLGLTQQMITKSLTLDVSHGFRIILYTDGLTEGRQGGKGTVFGSKRLLRVFDESLDKDCQNSLDQILTKWKNHLAGSAPTDDTCVIILESQNIDQERAIAA